MGKKVDMNETARAVIAQAQANAPAPTLESLSKAVAAQAGQIVAQDAKLDAILAKLNDGRKASKGAKASQPAVESEADALLRPHRNVLGSSKTGLPQLGNLGRNIVVIGTKGRKVMLRNGRGSIYGARKLLQDAGKGAVVEATNGQTVNAAYRWDKATGELVPITELRLSDGVMLVE